MKSEPPDDIEDLIMKQLLSCLTLCWISLGAWAADPPADGVAPVLKPAEIKSADEVKKSADAEKAEEAKKKAQAKKKVEEAKKKDGDKTNEVKKADDTKKPAQAKKKSDSNKTDEAKKGDDAKKKIAKTADGKFTAEKLVEMNLKARGGLKTWQGASTLTFAGLMDAGGKNNPQLPFVLKMKRAHKSRLEIKVQDQTAVQVYDGTSGWKLRPFLGRKDAEPYTPTENKLAQAWDDLDGPLVDYAIKGTKITFEGKEVVEGQESYKVKLKLKDGAERRLWIDAKTNLEIKTDGQPTMLDGKMHKVAIFYRDYRLENGLMLPHLLETVVEGVKETHKMVIQSVAVNVPMDDALFAKPQLTMQSAALNK
jgi:hypothetical protein